MLFNFYLAPGCTICSEVWPQCRDVVASKKLLFNLCKVGKNYGCVDCDNEHSPLEISSDGIPNKEILVPLYSPGYSRKAFVSIPAFPAMGIWIDHQPILIVGSNIYKTLLWIVNDKGQNITLLELQQYIQSSS